jgi:hypothetical protein
MHPSPLPPPSSPRSQVQVQMVRMKQNPSYVPPYTTVWQVVKASIRENGIRGPWQVGLKGCLLPSPLSSLPPSPLPPLSSLTLVIAPRTAGPLCDHDEELARHVGQPGVVRNHQAAVLQVRGGPGERFERERVYVYALCIFFVCLLLFVC